MDGSEFDNLTRRFTRRGLMALAAAAALELRDGRAKQLGPPTCGQSGDVCTMLIGCCSGFTCVTSAINVNYGVCVSGGSGGTVSSGTGLISPFSEDIEQEIASMQSDPALTGTGTTDVTTPEERRAEIKARKDARQSRKSSRRTTRRSKIDSRRSTRQTENDAEEEADRIAAGPIVEGEIFNPGGQEDDIGGPEVLKVTNRDIGDISLVRIESISNPKVGTDFVDSRLPVLAVGESFNFFSYFIDDDDLGENEAGWTDTPICTADAELFAGFRVYVSFSANTAKREYEFRCDTPFTAAPLNESALPDNNRTKKRKQKLRAKKRQKAKSRNAKNGKR